MFNFSQYDVHYGVMVYVSAYLHRTVGKHLKCPQSPSTDREISVESQQLHSAIVVSTARYKVAERPHPSRSVRGTVGRQLWCPDRSGVPC